MLSGHRGRRAIPAIDFQRALAAPESSEDRLLLGFALSSGDDDVLEVGRREHDHTVAVADHNVCRSNEDVADEDRTTDRSRSVGMLGRPADTAPRREHWEPEGGDPVRVANAAIDDQSGNTALERGRRHDLSEVAVFASPACMYDNDIPWIRLVDCAMHHEVVAGHCLHGHRWTDDLHVGRHGDNRRRQRADLSRGFVQRGGAKIQSFAFNRGQIASHGMGYASGNVKYRLFRGKVT